MGQESKQALLGESSIPQGAVGAVHGIHGSSQPHVDLGHCSVFTEWPGPGSLVTGAPMEVILGWPSQVVSSSRCSEV